MPEITERIELLQRLLDPEDYRYIKAQSDRMEAHFRRERMRIYRIGLRELMATMGDLYQARLSAMNAAGQWSAYPGLAWNTLGTFWALGRLWMAGTLFRFRLPLLVDVAAQHERLLRMVTHETSGETPGRLLS